MYVWSTTTGAIRHDDSVCAHYFEQKEWLDNTLPDPYPCTAGNKEEERIPDTITL